MRCTCGCVHESVTHGALQWQFSLLLTRADPLLLNLAAFTACFTMPHLAHVAVATLALVIFAILATPFTMAEIDLNPVSKNALGMGHTK